MSYQAQIVSFATLKPGEFATILGFVQTDPAYRQKLLAMGLTPGSQFEVLRCAPLGDPVEIFVRGSALSLRKHEANCLLLEKN